jgi:prophage regulatory protein
MPMNDTKLNGPRLLRLREVLQLVPLGRATIYRAIKLGDFPRPCKLLGGRAAAWSQDEINAWIDARLHERDEASR